MGEPKNENIGWPFAPGLRHCPISVIEDRAWQLHAWWMEWKRLGVLPWGGCDLLEQPEFVVQAFTRIEQVTAEIEAKQQREAQREMERLYQLGRKK